MSAARPCATCTFPQQGITFVCRIAFRLRLCNGQVEVLRDMGCVVALHGRCRGQYMGNVVTITWKMSSPHMNFDHHMDDVVVKSSLRPLQGLCGAHHSSCAHCKGHVVVTTVAKLCQKSAHISHKLPVQSSSAVKSCKMSKSNPGETGIGVT